MSTPRYWRESMARYNLFGSECGRCGRMFFPSRVVCPHCHRDSMGKMKSVRLPREGQIFSYTVVHDPHPAYKLQTPYILAMVEMQGGIRMLGQVVDCDPEEVGVGRKVRVCFRKLTEEGSQGIIHYGYKFVLAEGGDGG